MFNVDDHAVIDFCSCFNSCTTLYNSSVFWGKLVYGY